MTALKLEVELTYDDALMHGEDREARDWFFNHILRHDRLTMYSDEIGDNVGSVVVPSVSGTSVVKRHRETPCSSG